MNESASKASLASSSGKPSTANSTGSSGRKTRTIIVARTIPDEPAQVTPASHGDSSTVANQQHSRDVRSGKLASYAALGGVEDVERFDHFLAEQRGHPSASELRAAVTSPHHMQASMKRKSMNLIQLEDKSSEAEPTAEDAAMRKLMQQELESDARKRREEAVAQRKWLNSLPIHERVAQQRQQNALRKWRQMNQDWETFKARAARRLGKAPQELVMSRAAAYREQRETYDALQKARPLSDKVGGDIWLVSLRNEGTRYVPVGNIFSGLFCPIRESTKLGPSVRRPLDYYDNQQDREHEASRPLSKLERRSLELLARKKWRLRKQLEVLQPHQVEHSSSSHLAVGTSDLFAWASGTTQQNNPEDDDEGSLRMYSAGTAEASRRRRLRSYASPSSPKTRLANEAANQFVGPSLRIVHVAEAGEDLLSTTESSGAEPLRLSLYTPVGEQEQRSLSITNDGTTIVHYQWWRAPFEDDNAELTSRLRGRRTRREEQELERATTTSVSKLGGTLLPGETQPFVFTFESSRPGVFLEKWLLDADPQPRICVGGDAASEHELPAEVRLRCVAQDNFAAWRRRELQLTRVEQRESRFFVANLVDEILDGVSPPEAVVFRELGPREELTRFYEQNASTEFGDVYFSPSFVSGCHALYERAQGVLRALTPVQLPVTVEDEAKQELAVDVGDSEGMDKSNDAALPEPNGTEDQRTEAGSQQEAENGPAHRTQEWNWRLETLRELCKMADEALQMQIRRLTQELKKESDDVEEEDDNEEEEENEDDGDGEEDEEDEESGDGGEDDDNAESKAGESPRLSPREIRKNERLARRKALEGEINALQPNLQEAFDTMRYSAYTAPYSSTRLQERLHERLGSLASETPVVCEIAQAMNISDNSSTVHAAKIDGVAKLLARAIDEAVGGDLDHQTLFEQERRRIQGMWLPDKASYLSINELMASAQASTSQLPRAIASVESTEAASPEVFDNSGVLLMQVDLDLAPWFALVKAETKAAVPVEDAPRKIELAWRFSQDLAQHSTFVPAKVAQAAESLEKVLSALASTNPAVHTIVLVSELSRPPLTKQMCKLLRSAAQAELKVPVSSQLSAEAEDAKTSGVEEGGETEATIMNSLLQRLASHLSLRSVAQVLQRAVQKDVVFCPSVEEAQGQIDFGRKEQQLNGSISLGGIENGALIQASDVNSTDQLGAAMAPRIVLLEHLDAAGVAILVDAARKRELASKPTTPAVPDTQKPAAGAGKKAPAKGKPGTPGTSAVPVPTPATETPSSSTRDLSILTATGKELTQQAAEALRTQLARMARACILDGIPSQQSEGVFAFAADSPEAEGRSLPPPIVVGPALYQEVCTWSQTLQPMLACSDTPRRVLTAVVGGKSLESKLRLIDGLLEIVHEIYFVGEVAMSLYRVLHAKQTRTLDGHQSGKREEEEEELEEDAEAEADETIAEEIGDEKAADAQLPLGRARAVGLWDLLVPAVEKLRQKASRKCVRLMLPIDWIVGDTSLEEQDLNSAAVVEDDEEDDDEEEEDEAEEEEGRGKKSRKRRASEIKSARQKPLVEPDDVDVFEQKQHATYEGERAHVVLSQAYPAPSAGWRTFADVNAHCLANARVAEGKASVLNSLWSESEGDDADEEGEEGLSSTPPAKFEFEWTFRALDVGPIAMQSLASSLSQGASPDGSEEQDLATTVSRALIVNGVCGAVAFRESCAGTKQLLGILRGFRQRDVFIAGRSTAEWLRQLEIEELNHADQGTIDSKRSSEESANAHATSLLPARPRKVVDDRTMRNARVLKQLLAAKPHPVLATLA